MEIMIVLVILSVLAGLAVPSYFRTIEQARINEAATTLSIIHMGEKIYRINNSSFLNVSPPTPGNINTLLNVDISPQYYTNFTFSSFGPGPAFTNGYECTVTRNSTQGGDPRWSYRYRWNNSTATLTKTRCTPACVDE